MEYVNNEKVNSRSNSVINSNNYSETSLKYFKEKIKSPAIEHKFIKDNKISSDKLKNNDRVLFEKYSKLFKFNNEDSMFWKMNHGNAAVNRKPIM